MPEVLRWGAAAAEAFGYPPPDEAWAKTVARRLPAGLLSPIEHGVRDGLVIVDGHQFTLPRLPGERPKRNGCWARALRGLGTFRELLRSRC